MTSCSRLASHLVIRSSGPCIPLRSQIGQSAREGNRFADMIEATDPGDRALDPEAKAAVNDRTITAQV